VKSIKVSWLTGPCKSEKWAVAVGKLVLIDRDADQPRRIPATPLINHQPSRAGVSTVSPVFLPLDALFSRELFFTTSISTTSKRLSRTPLQSINRYHQPSPHSVYHRHTTRNTLHQLRLEEPQQPWPPSISLNTSLLAPQHHPSLAPAASTPPKSTTKSTSHCSPSSLPPSS
jgi:hypothetical protein